MILGPLVLVVVGELLSGPNGAKCVDEDSFPLDHRLTIGITRVVDEARIVASNGGIDDRLVVDDEQERVVSGHLVVVVATVGFVVADTLSRVLDDALPTANQPRRERSPALDIGFPQLKWRFPSCGHSSPVCHYVRTVRDVCAPSGPGVWRWQNRAAALTEADSSESIP